VMTCRPQFVELFATAPFGVKVVAFDPREARTFGNLFRLRGFDLALLPADNRFSWLARALDARWIVAFEGDKPAYKNWLVDELRSYPEHAMALGDLIADRLVDGPAPASYVRSDWPAPHYASFSMPDDPYCVLHVGASTPLRHWEPDKWKALVARVQALGLQAVVSAGPGEQGLVRAIDPEGRLKSFPGTLSLAQLWRLFEKARAVVCPDTGAAHLARLVGVPLVVLFGPGSATLFGGGDFWRNAPERKVTIPAFPCRDENIIFRRHLPWAGHCGRTLQQCPAPRCMQALSADMVAAALAEIVRDAVRWKEQGGKTR
jgi:ADP-heptose:LPS heptosyltransferase